MNLEDLDFDYISTAGILNKEIKAGSATRTDTISFLTKFKKSQRIRKSAGIIQGHAKVFIFVTGSNSTLLSGEMNTS